MATNNIYAAQYITPQDLKDYGYNTTDKEREAYVQRAIEYASTRVNYLTGNYVMDNYQNDISKITDKKIADALKYATFLITCWFLQQGIEFVRGSVSFNVGSVSASQTMPDQPDYIPPLAKEVLQAQGLYRWRMFLNQSCTPCDPNGFWNPVVDQLWLNWDQANRAFIRKDRLISSDNSIGIVTSMEPGGYTDITAKLTAKALTTVLIPGKNITMDTDPITGMVTINSATGGGTNVSIDDITSYSTLTYADNGVSIEIVDPDPTHVYEELYLDVQIPTGLQYVKDGIIIPFNNFMERFSMINFATAEGKATDMYNVKKIDASQWDETDTQNNITPISNLNIVVATGSSNLLSLVYDLAVKDGGDIQPCGLFDASTMIIKVLGRLKGVSGIKPLVPIDEVKSPDGTLAVFTSGGTVLLTQGAGLKSQLNQLGNLTVAETTRATDAEKALGVRIDNIVSDPVKITSPDMVVEITEVADNEFEITSGDGLKSSFQKQKADINKVADNLQKEIENRADAEAYKLDTDLENFPMRTGTEKQPDYYSVKTYEDPTDPTGHVTDWYRDPIHIPSAMDFVLALEAQVRIAKALDPSKPYVKGDALDWSWASTIPWQFRTADPRIGVNTKGWMYEFVDFGNPLIRSIFLLGTTVSGKTGLQITGSIDGGKTWTVNFDSARWTKPKDWKNITADCKITFNTTFHRLDIGVPLTLGKLYFIKYKERSFTMIKNSPTVSERIPLTGMFAQTTAPNQIKETILMMNISKIELFENSIIGTINGANLTFTNQLRPSEPFISPSDIEIFEWVEVD